MIEWSIQVDIYFAYLDKNILKEKFKDYLKDRLVSENEFLGWDENSIELLSFKKIKDNLYLSTISINALLWYDFDIDYNWIKELIIEQIAWKNVDEAKKILLSFSQIAWVEIKTNNLNKIAKLKSRIYLHISR